MNLPVYRYNTSLTYVHYIEMTSTVECEKYGISMGDIFSCTVPLSDWISC